jgi:hypothetical protein
MPTGSNRAPRARVAANAAASQPVVHWLRRLAIGEPAGLSS